MRMTVIGAHADVIGFALAGVDGATGDTRDAVATAIRQFRADADVAVIAVSAAAAALAPGEVAAAAAAGAPGLPLIVVLPAPGDGGARS